MAITAALLFVLGAIHAAPVDPYRGSTSLNLQDMGIQIINENQFSPYSRIERLDLSNNGIYDIHSQGFCGLNSLFSLDLSGNEIQYLHPDTFKCTPSLERLKLKNNMKLGSEANIPFLSSVSIAILDISFCDFMAFSDKMFSGMKSLQTVIAYKNPACLKTISFWDDRRLECGSPRNTDLQPKDSDSSNAIVRHETSTTILPNSVSTEQEQIQYTGISNVQMEAAEKSTVGSSLMKIDKTSTETSKDMEANEQKTVDVIETKEQRIDGQTQLLKTETTKRWHKYDEKELSENFLKEYKTEISKTREIPAYYFVKIRDITSLDLSDLNILSIHRLAFCGLNSLTVLNLSTNDLQYLHPHTFHCTPHLQKLKLSDNPRLGLHTHSMFIKSRSLEQLDISFCNFDTLPENMFDSLPNLKFLNAFGNSGCPQIVNQNKDIEHVPCSESGLDLESSSSLTPGEGEKEHSEISPTNGQHYNELIIICSVTLFIILLIVAALIFICICTPKEVYMMIKTHVCTVGKKIRNDTSESLIHNKE